MTSTALPVRPPKRDAPAPRDDARTAAMRHSRRVRRLKVLLPTAVGLLVLVIAGMVLVAALGSGINLGTVEFGRDGIVMADPRLSGHDAENRSYEVTAKRAVQSLSNPKVVTMEQIAARIKLGDGSWATFDAVEGVFDGEREHLSLTKEIRIDSSHGYKATLQGADVDLRGGTVKSAEPFELTSDQGSIKAGTLEVQEEGRVIRFGGGITMTLNPGVKPKRSDPVSELLAKEAAK